MPVSKLFGFTMLRTFRRIACLLAVVFSAALYAHAHAVLVRSVPGEHSVIHGSNLNVDLVYNSRIDARRSVLTLTDSNGKQFPLQKDSASSPAELKAAARGLASGAYTLHWQVLASDGHITRGDVAFTVVAK